MTLLEALIACALVVIVGVMIGELVFPLLGSTRSNLAKSRLQQDAMVALNRLEADLRMSASSGITMVAPSTSSLAVAIDCLKKTPFQGTAEWENRLVIYSWSDGTLLRKTWPPQPPMAGPKFTGIAPTLCPPADLLDMARTVNGSETVLARHTTGFSVTAAGRGAYTVALEIEAPIDDQRTERLQTVRSVQVRNH